MSTESAHKLIIPFIISLALFMEAVDTTIINTAIPSIAVSLQVNPVNLKIALISYLLSLSIFIPISGWLGDKWGIKRVFMVAIIIFTFSSLWCGFARTLWELVIARALQGFGGSCLLPIGRLIILRMFARHELVDVMNRVVMVAALGLMLGPVLGGFITHYFSWHWIFWVNIPVGFFTFLMVLCWLPEIEPMPVKRLDKLGFILFGSGLAGLTFGLSAFSETTISTHLAFIIMLISCALLVAYYLHSRHCEYPVINTSLFNYRTFQIAVLGNVFSRLGFSSVPFILPLLLQIVFRYTPQSSGLLIAPMAVGVLLVKLITLPILRKIGFRRLLIINTVFVSFSLCSFIFINQSTSIYIIVSCSFIFGFLTSLQYSGMNSLAYADVAAEKLSSATSIMSTMQQVSQSFGVAVGALCIRLFSSESGSSSVLTQEIFHKTFLAISIITLFSVLIFSRLQMTDGDNMLNAVTSDKIVT